MHVQRVFQRLHGLAICNTYSSLSCYSPVRLKHSKNELEQHKVKVMSRGLPERKPLPGVKSIVLVASGKGGVGKTTTAVNLACAMKVIEPDKEIGLLDADVFGPSVPLMMNISGEPMLNDENLIEPLLNYGVKCMSMGLLVAGENAVVWRGLMVMQALERLTRQVAWGPLDVLVVDTPPGTGDTHLSLAQNLPIDGAIIVTTPQSAALQVTKRGVNMFEKLKVPVIGLVENMSHAICSKCGERNYVFGNETKQTAKDMGLEIIASFEVDQSMSECINSGKPAIYALPDSTHAEKYRQLANRVFKYIDKEKAELEQLLQLGHGIKVITVGTTTAVNLACAMKVIEPDKEIGLLDADVFGPSVPLMMNISGEPMLNDENLIEPLLNYGVKCMSMGLLVAGENAVVWRGLMVMQALERLTRQVAWGPLDVLVVDTPPGTGDTHLSLAQNLPIDGAIIVTTPQSAALQVTKRGVNMFEKLKVPVIGLVENMSHAICSKCGERNYVFGNETKQTAKDMGLEIIASFEVDQSMSECINSGKPAIYALPDSTHAEKYRQLANRVFKYIDKEKAELEQ